MGCGAVVGIGHVEPLRHTSLCAVPAWVCEEPPQKKMNRVKKRLGSDVMFSEQVENMCIGAFVTFEHRESKRRCLADYQVSHSWWGLGGCCLPLSLYFRKRCV